MQHKLISEPAVQQQLCALQQAYLEIRLPPVGCAVGVNSTIGSSHSRSSTARQDTGKSFIGVVTHSRCCVVHDAEQQSSLTVDAVWCMT